MENNLVNLTEDEKNVVKQYKQKLDSEIFLLGTLRKNFLSSEKQFVEKCNKADQDLIDHLNILAKAKNISINDEQWGFNFESFSFSKV